MRRFDFTKLFESFYLALVGTFGLLGFIVIFAVLFELIGVYALLILSLLVVITVLIYRWL